MTEELKIALVGDIMCGDSFSLMGKGTATMIDRYGSRFLSAEIVDFFHAHDMVLGNIECVLSDVGRKEISLRKRHMRGRPGTAKLLSEWGLTVANIANNHILEQGRDAALDTAYNLRQCGIEVVGAGNAMQKGFERVCVPIKGMNVDILGICLRDEKYAYDGGMNITEAIEQIKICRKESDIVIVSVHWGDELIEYPGLPQRQLARQLQQAGADIIMGHHPHVFQGLDLTERAVTAYSLGNFIFDGFSTATGWSIIFSVTICRDKTLVCQAVPIVRDHHFRPQLANGSQKSKLLEEIERRNADCRMSIENEGLFVRQYNDRVKMLRESSRKALWKNLAKRFFTFNPVFWPQLLMRPISRRMGTW
jgi:poly-gamma-glutamate synthesis protein (capsule biosynthesis protein)